MRHVLSIVVLASIASSCVSSADLLGERLEDSGRRFPVQDLSVGSPGSNEWIYRGTGQDFVYFFMDTGDENHSVSAMLAISNQASPDLPALQKFLEGDSSLTGTQKEIRIVEEGDAGYVKSHVEARSPDDSGKMFLMISDARTYLHPRDQRQIHLTVSQRFPEGGEPVDLSTSREAFLGSLRFEKPSDS